VHRGSDSSCEASDRFPYRSATFADASPTSFGAASSMLQIGPPSYSGPRNLTNAGALPPTTQKLTSGGCFPIMGATAPAKPPRSVWPSPQLLAFRGASHACFAEWVVRMLRGLTSSSATLLAQSLSSASLHASGIPPARGHTSAELTRSVIAKAVSRCPEIASPLLAGG
jgi:hypothetical protein